MNRPGFLWSYFYFRPAGPRGKVDDPAGQIAKMYEGDVPLIFVDSGAFSAYSTGEQISVREYGDWLENWHDRFDHYANLDVKGDAEAGVENLAYLRARGLHPLPVFHGGEPWSLLEGFCEECDYVALGGISGAAMAVTNPKVLSWLDRCFRIAARHQTKLHGFGISSFKALRAFPWHSADSTSWHGAIRYGEVALFDHYRGRWISFRLEDRKAWHRYGWLVREHGFEPNAYGDLLRVGSGRPEVVELLAATWCEAATWIERRNRNFQLYLVDDNPQHQTWANRGIRRWLDAREPVAA